MKHLSNYNEIKPYIENLHMETLDIVELLLENQSEINNNIISNNKLNINILKDLLVIIEGFFNSKKIVLLLCHSEEENEALKIIAYYFAKYFLTLKRNHPFLKMEKIEELVDFIVNVEMEDSIHHFNCTFSDFYLMIDKHFITKYKNCNYNIFHFLSNGVLVNRFYETCY